MAGWSKTPHSVYDTDRLTFEEKAMLAFLIDRQNKFNTDWFGFSDNDFIKAGYGRNVSRWKPSRDKLIQLGLISYKKQRGKKSQYKVNDVDSILEQEKEMVETKPVNKVEAQPKQVKHSDAVNRFFKQHQGFLATAENRLRNGDRSVNDDIQMRINTYADKYGITDEEIQQIWESI